jgi:hypothetical protein
MTSAYTSILQMMMPASRTARSETSTTQPSTIFGQGNVNDSNFHPGSDTTARTTTTVKPTSVKKSLDKDKGPTNKAPAKPKAPKIKTALETYHDAASSQLSHLKKLKKLETQRKSAQKAMDNAKTPKTRQAKTKTLGQKVQLVEKEKEIVIQKKRECDAAEKTWLESMERERHEQIWG